MGLGGKKPIKEEESKTVEISAQMQGAISFNDPVNLKISGKFTGNLTTKGTLTIGTTADVEANINGENIIIAGKVKGEVVATKMLVLMPTAMLRGNIATPKLNIVEGAIFEGSCKMSELAASDDLLSIEEVAQFLEINIQEIQALASAGRIPGIRINNTWKFERSRVDSWAATAKVK